MTRGFLKGFVLLAIFTGSMVPVSAAGSYSEGQVFMTIRKFESSGIFIESWEGTAEVQTYDSAEVCKQEENLCYTPKKDTFSFSVRPETDGGRLAAELQKSINKEVLVSFKIHRVEAMGLSTSFEVTGIIERTDRLPGDVPSKKVVKKTGGKRNFSVLGKILRLEYMGTAVGTYEGLYFDTEKGKIHPFSITDTDMAKHAYKVMGLRRDYNLGISQAFVTGVRKSDYDLFEVNLNEPAGAAEVAPEEKKPE